MPRWDKVHQVMNVDEFSWTFMNIHQWFIKPVHKHIKTVHDISWILMNTWWTDFVHDLVHEVHMERLWTVMIFYELDRS